MESSIERELTEITKVSRRKKEDEQKYLTRLADSVQALPEDDWDRLSKDAQLWANEAAKAQDADKPIAAFSTENDEQTDEQTSEGGQDMATNGKSPVKAKAKAKKSAAKAPAKKVAAKKGTVTPRAPKALSPTAALRRIVVKNPLIAVPALVERLKKEGHKMSPQTAGSLAADTRATLKALKSTGLYEAEGI